MKLILQEPKASTCIWIIKAETEETRQRQTDQHSTGGGGVEHDGGGGGDKKIWVTRGCQRQNDFLFCFGSTLQADGDGGDAHNACGGVDEHDAGGGGTIWVARDEYSKMISDFEFLLFVKG